MTGDIREVAEGISEVMPVSVLGLTLEARRRLRQGRRGAGGAG